MANITGTWSYGKFIAYTDLGESDDSETWSYGKVLSVLEYFGAIIASITFVSKQPGITFVGKQPKITFEG